MLSLRTDQFLRPISMVTLMSGIFLLISSFVKSEIVSGLKGIGGVALILIVTVLNGEHFLL